MAVASRAERVFRACGVAPLGVFVLLHVLLYSRALLGVRALGSADGLRLSPWVIAVELVLVAGPLAFHALYGLHRLARGPGLAAAGSAGALDRLQRYSSPLLLVFIVDHYVRFRWPMLTGELAPVDAHGLLVRELASTSAGLPLVAAFQLVGAAVTAFHLGYGLYRYDWPLPWLASARRRTWLGAAVGLTVLLAASFTFIQLATGKRLVPTLG